MKDTKTFLIIIQKILAGLNGNVTVLESNGEGTKAIRNKVKKLKLQETRGEGRDDVLKLQEKGTSCIETGMCGEANSVAAFCTCGMLGEDYTPFCSPFLLFCLYISLFD